MQTKTDYTLMFVVTFKEDSTTKGYIQLRGCPSTKPRFIERLFDATQDPGASFADIAGIVFNNERTDIESIEYMEDEDGDTSSIELVDPEEERLVSIHYQRLLSHPQYKTRTIEEQKHASLKRLKRAEPIPPPVSE